VLVKTHGWSAAWRVARAAHVLLTHRDLRGVVASYRRMGWAADLKCGYVEDHLRWRARLAWDIYPDAGFAQSLARLWHVDRLRPRWSCGWRAPMGL
jgi:hypothetical protein